MQKTPKAIGKYLVLLEGRVDFTGHSPLISDPDMLFSAIFGPSNAVHT
jgi:hypothetical protein